MKNFLGCGPRQPAFSLLPSAFSLALPMPDLAPNPELLRSLGRLVRGLSALFWGLPAALIVCVGTVTAGWFNVFGIVPAMVTTGLLFFGLWQLGSFQKQERPWQSTLDRAKLLALVNFGLSPFLYWSNRIPGQFFFGGATALMILCALLFLFSLNLVVLRLGAMLPDETLRLETRQFTALNRTLLTIFLLLGAIYYLFSRGILYYYSRYLVAPEHPNLSPVNWELRLPFGGEIGGAWLVLMVLCLMVLLPLAMTMSLLWKTKEVILDSVFGGGR
jgi:hypothetical protein